MKRPAKTENNDQLSGRSALSESLEDYLEVILALEESHKVARAKDIADRLQLQRGSVTSALKTLADKGLINYEPYSFITLTEQGRGMARQITDRHHLLKSFLIRVLQVDPETADKTACRLEHAVDPQTFQRLTSFLEYITNCPRAGEQWIRSFQGYCATHQCPAADCQQCINAIPDEGTDRPLPPS